MAQRKKAAPRKPKGKAVQVEVLPPEKPQAPKKKIGRPSSYTAEMGRSICDMIAGRIPLKAVCETEGMPSRDTVYRWKRDIPAFADMYARAREHRAEARCDEIEGIIEKLHLRQIDPQVARVIIDAEKWLMSKENPRLYGDKVALTDPDGGALTVKITV